MKLGMAYMGAYLPEHLRNDLTEMRRTGCDEVIITLSENDFHVLQGKVRFAPRIAHDLGLRLLANFWGFACAFGGGRVSRLLTERIDCWLVRRDGRLQGEGCMNHPALLQRGREMVDECVSRGYDGFFWDEPTRQDCYCGHCRRLFREQSGEELTAAEPARVEAFRMQSVSGYVDAMSGYVKSVRGDLETSTCVMPHDEAAWDATARIGSLDTFGTDPYWMHFGWPLPRVTDCTRAVVDLCRRRGKRSMVWLQGWLVQAGREVEIEEAARRIAAERPDALYTWSYRASMGSDETSADPVRCWDEIVRVYGMLRRAEGCP